MYSLFKNIYKVLIPKSWQFKIEPLIRKIVYFLAYKGGNTKCLICSAKSKKYISISFYNSEEIICPRCGALSRSRALGEYVKKNFKNQSQKILDFSPHRSLHDFFKSIFENYISSDFENQFFAQKNYDITKINEADQSFDLIICFHVLEHILEDKKAIKELNRVLKNDGHLLIQVPLKKGETYQDNSIISKEGRLKAFGQEDHVRIYGEDSLPLILNESGFTAKPIDIVKEYNSEEKKLYGFSENEVIYVCRKATSS
jgi:predicted SAM-dependent methyltransferase